MISAEISILIPAYGADAFIASALNGIAKQTFKNWELIVIEDGSQGETERIVAGFAAQFPQHHVIYERSPRNMGVSHTRNKLIELAQTNFFAFLDADDVWMPEHLQRGFEEMQAGADFVISGIRIRQLPEGKEKSFPFPNEHQLENPVESLLRQNFIQSSSMVMMSRRGWEASGPFDSRLAIGEDLDVWLRAVNHGGITHTRQYTCVYTRHAASAMANTMQVLNDRILFLRKQRRIYPIHSNSIHARMAEAHLNLSRFVWRKHPLAASYHALRGVYHRVASVFSLF